MPVSTTDPMIIGTPRRRAACSICSRSCVCHASRLDDTSAPSRTGIGVAGANFGFEQITPGHAPQAGERADGSAVLCFRSPFDVERGSIPGRFTPSVGSLNRTLQLLVSEGLVLNSFSRYGLCIEDANPVDVAQTLAFGASIAAESALGIPRP